MLKITLNETFPLTPVLECEWNCTCEYLNTHVYKCLSQRKQGLIPIQRASVTPLSKKTTITSTVWRWQQSPWWLIFFFSLDNSAGGGLGMTAYQTAAHLCCVSVWDCNFETQQRRRERRLKEKKKDEKRNWKAKNHVLVWANITSFPAVLTKCGMNQRWITNPWNSMHWKYMELSIPTATTSRLKWTSACVILLPPIPDKQKRAEFRIFGS